MAGRIQHEEHDAQRQQDLESGRTIELLSDSLQHQLLGSHAGSPKRPTSLLHLPLVLVRKILQHVVQCYSKPRKHRTMKLFPLLDLRRVHSFLDAELTWLLGRNLERWEKADRKACLYRAPTLFVIRILEACIGDRDRGGCEFAAHMHSVIDTLVEQFKQLGAPKQRDEMLQAVCRALATRSWQRDLFRRGSEDWNTYALGDDMPKYWSPMPTAFVVAIQAKFEDLVVYMLETSPIVPHDIRTNKGNFLADAESIDFGLPIELAIVSGQAKLVQKLMDHDAELAFWDRAGNLSTCTALEVAAQRGHAHVLDLVLPQLFSGEVSQPEELRLVGKVMKMAARHQQWHIVHSLLEQHAPAMKTYNQHEYLDRALYIAARYGQDDVVSALLPWVETPTHGFPLRDAAGGGHLSTCKLLLWEGPRPEQSSILQQSEVFARAVAKSGNVEICKLLRPHFFWHGCHEIHFLPIAAELGYLEFAKYAVANRCDKQVYFPYDIRYFALLRAIISGHVDVIRWMVNDLGVNICQEDELIHPPIDPWHLAAHANTSAKLRLSLGSSDELEVWDCEQGPTECMETTMKTLDVYQRKLFLRKDYSRDWCKNRVRDV